MASIKMSTKRNTGAGRKTVLDKELTLEIRSMVLKGAEYKNIQQKLGINANTWDTWVYEDYQGFRGFLNDTKREVLLNNAERASKFILNMLNKKNTRTDTNLLRLIQKESEFVRETLGKSLGYSKRQELTGRDGEDLVIKSIIFHPPMGTRAEANVVREAEVVNEKTFINAETPIEEFKEAVRKVIAERR